MNKSGTLDLIHKVNMQDSATLAEMFWDMADNVLDGTLEPASFGVPDPNHPLYDPRANDSIAQKLSSDFMNQPLPRGAFMLIGSDTRRYHEVVTYTAKRHILFNHVHPDAMLDWIHYIAVHEGEHATAVAKTRRWTGSAAIAIEKGDDGLHYISGAFVSVPVLVIPSLQQIRADVYAFTSAPQEPSDGDHVVMNLLLSVLNIDTSIRRR